MQRIAGVCIFAGKYIASWMGTGVFAAGTASESGQFSRHDCLNDPILNGPILNVAG